MPWWLRCGHAPAAERQARPGIAGRECERRYKGQAQQRRAGMEQGHRGHGKCKRSGADVEPICGMDHSADKSLHGIRS
eukprot:5763783-Pleurochrysis_carterae.AAC.1